MAKIDLDFNPNKLPPTIEWATYVPDRTTAPKFKVHTNRGHALNALTGIGILFRFVDGRWVEVYRCDDDEYAHKCDVCNKSTLREYEGSPNTWKT